MRRHPSSKVDIDPRLKFLESLESNVAKPVKYEEPRLSLLSSTPVVAASPNYTSKPNTSQRDVSAIGNWHSRALTTKQSHAAVPKGYAPKKELLFNYPLNDGETLVATFEFTPAKWTKELLSADMFPRTLGSTLGIGHITSSRILLFYDLKKIHGKNTCSGKQMETIGKHGSKLLERTTTEVLGKLFESAMHIETETREYMEKVTKRFAPHGVVAFPRAGDWGSAFGHVFFDDQFPRRSGVPITPVAFAPGFIDSSGSGDASDIFRKLLAHGGVAVRIEEENTIPCFGSRRELEGSIF